MTWTPDGRFNVGLQAERTALAWQRTALSFAVASLLGARLLLDVFNILSYIVAALGMGLTAMVFLIGHQRYRSVQNLLQNSLHNRIPLVSAVPLLMWATTTFFMGLFGLSFAVLLGIG